MNQDEHKIMVRRMAALIAVASVLIAVYVLRLIFLQLVNGESFKAQATNTTDYNFTVTAARGDIVDSAGRRIAASTTSYNVVLSKLLMGDEDLDTMLQKVVDLLEAHGESWNDSCLLYTSDAADEEDSVERGGRRINKKKKTKIYVISDCSRDPTALYHVHA